jgi:geranylgeranyl pyrophosphate synthase
LGEGREGTGPAPRARGRTPLTALRTFGREIGLAFQLLDDVLDVTGPPERTGKARGTDLLDGTVTLPLILARERDRSLVELGLRGLDAQGAEAVCDRIAATGVLEEVRAGARRRVELAKLALQRSGFEPDQRQLLELVADGVVERYS